jgi:hypothetical protein
MEKQWIVFHDDCPEADEVKGMPLDTKYYRVEHGTDSFVVHVDARLRRGRDYFWDGRWPVILTTLDHGLSEDARYE